VRLGGVLVFDKSDEGEGTRPGGHGTRGKRGKIVGNCHGNLGKSLGKCLNYEKIHGKMMGKTELTIMEN